MRFSLGSLGPLLLILGLGCSTVDPAECWVNTSGGLGGGGTIPVVAAVGANTGGDFFFPPSDRPFDAPGAPNPCVASDNSGQGGTSSRGETSGRGGTGMAGHAPTLDEQAAIALARADPTQLALGQVRTDYAAYDLKELVESKIDDPATVDEATVAALIDMYAPIAWKEARQWVSTLDPSETPLAQVKPKYECTSKYGCMPTDTCDFPGHQGHAYCVITNCGEGKCPTCPSWFGWDKLIVKNWCTYTCMLNYQIVGISVGWNFFIDSYKSVCIPFASPIPCEGTCKP